MVLQLAPLALVFTLVLLSSVHAESYTVSTYHIKPTPDTPCPAVPCHTLSEYAQGLFLTSDTTLIFLPGNHSLDRDIAVTNVTRFVMLGDSTSSPENASTIVCSGPHLLTFFNISQLHIYFLQITSCGSGTVPAVSVVSVYHVQILGSVFGTASLLVIGSMLNCSGTNFSSSLGTGLVLSNGYVELHSSVFSNNLGGGINSTSSTLTLTGNNTFMNNTAEIGGGISATESSIYINGNIAFLDNSAGTSGGGVYIERSIFRLTCNGTMTYAGNIISDSDISTGVAGTGGGISALYSGVSLEGNSTFRGNVAADGGGLSVQFSQLSCSGYISFVNNHAADFGGGLLLYSSKGKLEGTSIFIRNTAYNAGGGLLSFNSSVKVEGDGRFINNSALYGGGILITYGGGLTLGGSNTFVGNWAQEGGRVNVQNSWLISRGNINFTNNVGGGVGGGVASLNSSVKLEGIISFVTNTAYRTGGGLSSVYGDVSVEGDSRFINNSAKFGGGIAVSYGGVLTLNGINTFVGNLANEGGGVNVQNSWLISRGNINFTTNLGGGVVSLNSSVKLEGIISFINNIAYHTGGGLSSEYGDVVVEGDGRFINNSAWYGGGIFIGSGGGLTLIGSNTFVGNWAHAGGGVKVQNAWLISRGNINFTSNLADDGGGVVSLNSSVKLEGRGTFISNTAYFAGGGLYSEYSNVSVERVGRFINNSAEFGGGIAIAYGGGLTLIGNNNFSGNKANQGGGINVRNSRVSSRGHISFTNNLANKSGGGLLSYNSNVKLEGNSSYINNTAYKIGGGLFAEYSTLSVEGDGRFINNSAYSAGGGLYSEYSNVSVERVGRFINKEFGGGIAIAYGGGLTLIGNNSFSGNKANQGGGINVQNSRLSSRGHISFTNNLANESGGGLLSYNSNVKLEGNSSYINNTAYNTGGGLFAKYSTFSVEGDGRFINNSAYSAGGALYTLYSNVSMEGDGRFIRNSAEYGGGIHTVRGSLTLNGNNSFEENLVYKNSGGIFVLNSSLSSRGHISFTNNMANTGCGGGILSINSSVQLMGNSSSLHSGYVLFVNNSATCGGGFSCFGTNMSIGTPSMFARNAAELGGGMGIFSGSTVTLSGMSTFTQNTARYGGGGNVVDGTISFVATTHFHNNSALYGGGIHGHRATLEITEVAGFTENSATYGGGLSLASGSQCLLSSNSTVYLKGNHAEQYGGAIFVADEPFLYCTLSQQSWARDSREYCFFQPLVWPDPSVHFVLENNTAEEAGTALYGGMVDRCDIQTSTVAQLFHSDEIFNKIFNITKRKNASRELGISSEPFRLCPCYYGHANCSQSEVTVTAYPGETFSVSLVAVGQRNGIVPSLIQSTIDGNGASLGDLQYAQSTKNACTPLHYTVLSINHSVTLTLLADGPCLDLGYSLQVNVDLRSCPVGFQLSEAHCICEQRLQKYTSSCDINDLKIGVAGSVWVGLDKTTDGIILHPDCPFDYCKSHSVRFTLNETDLQCNYDRTGLLCGGCQPGLSLALGSSHCLQCSSAYLSLLVGFALAGIVLVILLLVCKLTVAVGTINGLIFYANIIAVNQAVFFPSRDTNVVLDILRVFVAWLNLDLGVETCFYDGMDAYARTWLQFIFPVYIWILVCTVIILCYYKTWAVHMFGRNPVAVLATLFLLSYAKLLRTIITALSFTFLDYPVGSEVAVWLYDGNVRYLQGKHIPLFLVAMIVLLLLFLPYTVVLSLGQWIQARSRNRLFSWINNYRVKAFLDAYHGSFKPKHRYWHGLLLVVRTCLFLIFAFNRLGNPNVNLLAICVCTIALLVLLLLIGGNIYINWYLQILDISFIANTGVFAATTLYLRHTGGSQAVLVYIFVGTALATFTGMIIYHVTMQLKDSRVWRDIIHPKLQRQQRLWVAVPIEYPVADGDADVGPPHPPCATFINLRETLLEDSVPDVEDENRVAEPERCIVQRHAQPTQTVVNLQELIREDPANNVLPMIELH